MKRAAYLVLVLVPVVLAMVAFAGSGEDKAAEKAAVKGQEVQITGLLSCAFCTLAHPEKPCAAGCCSTCIKNGDAALITDGDGNMYVVLANEIKKAGLTPEQVALAGSQVVVKGLLVKTKGLQAIFVDSMTKVPEKQEG